MFNINVELHVCITLFLSHVLDNMLNGIISLCTNCKKIKPDIYIYVCLILFAAYNWLQDAVMSI